MFRLRNPCLPSFLQVPVGSWYNSRRIAIKVDVGSSKGSYLKRGVTGKLKIKFALDY